MPWIIRDATTNDITGESPMQSSTFNESILATHPDYVAYLLTDQKAEKIKALKGLRDATIGGGVKHTIASTDHIFQVDGMSHTMINGALAVKERGNSTFFPINWIDKGNQSVSVSSTDLTTVFDLSGRLYQASYNNYQTHRTAIDDATSQAELDAVDITSGWPTVPYTGV